MASTVDHEGPAASRAPTPRRDQLPFLVGVTGTNGKTSVVEFGRQLLGNAGVPTSTYGSLRAITAQGQRTTPMLGQPPDGMLHYFAAQRAEGVEAILFEAFSRPLALGLFVGTTVDVAVFTGIQLEHLESHRGDPRLYLAAKRRLFGEVLADDGVGIIACTAEQGHRFAATCDRRGVRTLHCGLDEGDVRLAGHRTDGDASVGNLVIDGVDHGTVRVPFPDPVTVTNALLAFATAYAQGADLDRLCGAMESLRAPPGRMEVVGDVRGALVIVDSCHNPSAVIVASLAARSRSTSGRLITVVGAGGNRDPQKRAPIGRAAASHADQVIVTDDNPRNEDPAAIRAQVRRGCPDGIEIADRGDAIRDAIRRAGPGDVVLIAGKGEESTLAYRDRRVAHDDRVVARAAIVAAGGAVRPPHPLSDDG